MHFVETMRGELTGGSGQHPIAFHVRAERQRGGVFALRGVMHAGPWASETTASGTVTLSVWPSRIAYDVAFTAADGRRLRLVGAKHPTPRRPVHSMSWLAVELRDEGDAVLAHGWLTFDLLDLPSFVASWLPVPSRAERRLEARHQAVVRAALETGS